MSSININNVGYSSQNLEKDLYKDTPVRFLGFTNELGTAVSDLCTASSGIIKNIPALSYIPAIGYIAADTFDKYKKGEDGTGKKPSIKMGLRELLSQCVTSIAAPTGVIIATKKVSGNAVNNIVPKLPKCIKNVGASIGSFLKTNNVTGKFLSKAGMPGKVVGVAVSLLALVASTKPIDKITDFVFEKVVDPILGINKKKENTQDTQNETQFTAQDTNEAENAVTNRYVIADENILKTK